jgi:tetratricopeptide (TPR) repeat protein
MKKFFQIYFIVLIVFQNIIISQNNKIDSLKNILSSFTKEKTDTNYIKTLYHLSLEYKKINLDSALSIAENGLKLAEKSDNKMILSKILFTIGDINYHKGKFKIAEQYLNKSLSLLKNNPDLYLEKDIYYELSMIYDTLGNYKLALINLKNYNETKEKIFNLPQVKEKLLKEAQKEFILKEQKLREENEKSLNPIKEDIQKSKVLIYILSSITFIMFILLVALLIRYYKVNKK